MNLGLLTENEQKIFEALDETYLQVAVCTIYKFLHEIQIFSF